MRRALGSHVLQAAAAAAFFAGCLDAPKTNHFGKAGAGGQGAVGPSAGDGGSLGAMPGSGGSGDSAGTSQVTAGSGGSGAKGGKGGKGGTGGKGGSSTGSGGSGNENTTGGMAGESGMGAGMAGEGGVNGGEGGVGASSSGGTAGGGTAGGGTGGAPPNPCDGLVVGGKSNIAVPIPSGVAQPSGTPGNLKAVDWAGFTGAISFTFDDGMQSQINDYSQLNAVGVPMTFYLVCVNGIGNAAWATAKADGHEIGNHTMHHCSTNGTSCWGGYSFTAGDTAAIDNEVDQCATNLRNIFGPSVAYTMASPNGDGAWATPASTRVLVNRGISDITGGVKPNDGTNPFDLPCHMAAEGELAVGGFNNVTDSAHTNKSWRIILNHSFGGDGGYHPVAISEVVAAMTYARDLGDMWVDTVVDIGAYWRAQKMLTAVTPVTSGSDLVYSWTLPANFPPGHYLRVKVDGGTVKQCGTALTWDDHGYYEIALDAGAVTISP